VTNAAALTEWKCRAADSERSPLPNIAEQIHQGDRVLPSRATALSTALCTALASYIIAMAAGSSLAEEKSGTKAEDSIVAVDTLPWSAIGKLNNGLFGACTAVLISDHYALTAAHCLYFKFLRRFLSPELFRFALAYDNQRLGDRLHVVAYYVPPTYDPRKPFETRASDWALLQVATDARPAMKPVPLAREVDLTEQTRLMTGGYSKRRQHKMSADKECYLVGSSSDEKILFDSCQTPDGFAGGPIIARSPDRQSYVVLGIHVGGQVWQGKPIGIAVSAAAIWPEIRACVEEHQCHFQHVAGAREPTAAEILAGLPNLGVRKVIDIVADRLCRGENCAVPPVGANALDEEAPPNSGRRPPLPAAGR
jgi:V8-like Glu-specific endopeptidase